tara:strand:+ start:9627 stop:10307 length:681 start_codon:yes stop_codon:yes gene_type:complete
MLAIIQARMLSKRLRGKVLKKINNKSILERVISNAIKSKLITKIIVATSKKPADKKIINLCKRKKIKFFRGEHENVYLRFLKILKKSKHSSFLRICADSPFLDPYLLDKFIYFFNNNNYDIVTNVLKRSFPKGQSIEIFRKKIFIDSYSKLKSKKDREHISEFFYKNYKDFKIKNIKNRKNQSKINLCVDRQKDLILANKIAIKFDNYNNRKKILPNIINFAKKFK